MMAIFLLWNVCLCALELSRHHLMSQNTELIPLGPKLPAFVSQPHAVAGPVNTWEHRALGCDFDQCPSPATSCMSELRFAPVLAQRPGPPPEQARQVSVALLLPGEWILWLARLVGQKSRYLLLPILPALES